MTPSQGDQMKKALLALTLSTVAALAAARSASASTIDYPANGVCHPDGNGSQAYYTEWHVANPSTTTFATYICPLKQISCPAGNCTYNTTVYAYDANSGSGIENDIICTLKVQGRNNGYITYTGTPVTQTTSQFNTSVTVTNPHEGWLTMVCTVGKNATGVNRSYITYFSNVTP
jgi:hypothetical protein